MKKTITVFAFILLAQGVSAIVSNAQPGRNAELLAESSAQTEAATAEMHTYLNEIGYAMLAERTETVARINTVEAANTRQALVREKILDLVGGIPEVAGPVVVREFGITEGDAFHIQNIAYESFPGYWVTANVYIPNGNGPFPALVIAPGHGAGKSSQYSWAANFASSGFVVLAIDPLGQGERMQHYDPELGTSKVEPSGEHEHANQTSLLIGNHIARYWIADGRRGIDYLTERSDVDASRIGTFGCSGGGTAAAYLAAMDDRIRAAAVSSFITSFKELLPGNGPQDAEQTLPGFIEAGLDFADWVELAAPRPYAIVAFERDFFPYAGSQWTYEEANRFYSLYGAGNQIEFIGGAGGHCNLGPVMPQVLSFLYKHLKTPGEEIPTFTRLRPDNPDDLIVTPTGQLSTSIGGDTAENIARRDARTRTHTPQVLTSTDELASLQARVRSEVRAVAKIEAQESDEVVATTTSIEQKEGYQLENISIESEPGITIDAVVGKPDGTEPNAVVLMMTALPNHRMAESADFVRLVQSGKMVIAFQPRGVLGEPPPDPDRLALGQYMPELLRAIVVGKTIVGMRVDDTIRLVNWALSREDVDPESITLYGRGGLGMAALHAASVDTRIQKVAVENTLVSYRMALEAGLHKNLSEILIPNVLLHYDVVELLQSVYPREVSLINPATPMGRPTLRLSDAENALSPVFETDQNLGTSGRIQLLRRGFRDPIPIE